MRRLTLRYRRWLDYQAKKGARSRVERSVTLHVISTATANQLVRLDRVGKIPRVMCLDNNFIETVGMLSELRVRTSRRVTGALKQPTKGRSSRIGWVRNSRDFTTLKTISAGAALMLAAEYDRISSVTGVPPATIDLHAWDPGVKATLAELGFFELLRLNVDVPESAGGLFIEKMVSGNEVNMSSVNEAIQRLFDRMGGDAGLRLQLASAVTDAVENVRSHAYPAPGPFSVPKWWFTGAVDQRSGKLTLAILDQGISIPRALPMKWGINQVVEKFLADFSLRFDPQEVSNDGKAIELAMKMASTSTGLSFRGKGLPKILEIIRSCPEGRLRIVSRCGDCIYSADGSKLVQTHGTPYLGTYLELEALLHQAPS